MFRETYREASDVFEISRPVISGAEEFLDRVLHHGEEVFGFEQNPTLVTVGDKIVPLKKPCLTVYQPDELKVTVFERRAPRTMNYAPKFHYAAGKFMHKSRALSYGLEVAGLPYDINPEEQREPLLRFSSVQPNNDFGVRGVGHELALSPDITPVTLMMIDQSRLCFRALSGISRRIMQPGSSLPINVPFARVPEMVRGTDLAEFMKRITRELPLILTLGAIRNPDVINQ